MSSAGKLRMQSRHPVETIIGFPLLGAVIFYTLDGKMALNLGKKRLCQLSDVCYNRDRLKSFK